jgi:hypothetical protein
MECLDFDYRGLIACRFDAVVAVCRKGGRGCLCGASPPSIVVYGITGSLCDELRAFGVYDFSWGGGLAVVPGKGNLLVAGGQTGTVDEWTADGTPVGCVPERLFGETRGALLKAWSAVVSGSLGPRV